MQTFHELMNSQDDWETVRCPEDTRADVSTISTNISSSYGDSNSAYERSMLRQLQEESAQKELEAAKRAILEEKAQIEAQVSSCPLPIFSSTLTT